MCVNFPALVSPFACLTFSELCCVTQHNDMEHVGVWVKQRPYFPLLSVMGTTYLASYPDLTWPLIWFPLT